MKDLCIVSPDYGGVKRARTIATKLHVSFNQFPVHCVAKTKGSEHIDPLNNFDYDLIIKKGTKKNMDNFSCS